MAENTHDISELLRMFHEYRAYKSSIMLEWRLIRSLYRGNFWNVFSKNLKEYTITPDWNYYEYVVQAFLNSVYSGAFIGTVTAVDADDMNDVDDLNAFIRYHWNKWGMKNKYLHVGRNGELYNLGAVRIDWDENKNHIKSRTLSADEVYLDPSVTDYKEGHAIFIERSMNIHNLMRDENFKDKATEWYKANKESITDKSRSHKLAGFEKHNTSQSKTVSLIECYVTNEDGMKDQVFILNEEVIIYENCETKLEMFPIAVYQPTAPDGGPYGNPRLTKIFNTVVALNLIDSMEATQVYRILNRVRFVNVDGRLNLRAFADYGGTPGASFEVKGPPKDLIHYEDIQTIPDQTNLKKRLEDSIFQVTGVDPYYKGRMTNSIQTTGATQAFQARVTMLTDNSRITQLEEFSEDITRIMIQCYYLYGKKYKVPKLSATGSNRVIGTHNVDFNRMRKKKMKFDYTIAASTLLPMNQANLFESIKALYEMQGQYGFKIAVVEAEDLIRYSDFPQKDLWLQRIEKMKQENTAEELVADLTNFASIFSDFLAKGLSEEQAAQQAITILIEEKNAMQEDPTLGRGFQ